MAEPSKGIGERIRAFFGRWPLREADLTFDCRAREGLPGDVSPRFHDFSPIRASFREASDQGILAKTLEVKPEGEIRAEVHALPSAQESLSLRSVPLQYGEILEVRSLSGGFSGGDVHALDKGRWALSPAPSRRGNLTFDVGESRGLLWSIKPVVSDATALVRRLPVRMRAQRVNWSQEEQLRIWRQVVAASGKRPRDLEFIGFYPSFPLEQAEDLRVLFPRRELLFSFRSVQGKIKEGRDIVIVREIEGRRYHWVPVTLE